uniref:SH3 domain-containing protein n=1 Tax=Leptobrachium leishanense TaxID=445787 RepID=A0A8C5LMM6_9ANUR
MGTLGDMLVLLDFHGQQEDELNIKVGEIIRNVKKTEEDGWLEGEINGKKGFFPQMFAKEIPLVFQNDLVSGKRYPRSIRRSNACSQNEKTRWCKAEYSYTPGKPDELELLAGEVYEILEEIEDGWCLGKKGNLIGAFPSNFVQEIVPSSSNKMPELKKNGKQRPKMMEVTFTPLDEKTLPEKHEDKPGVNQQKAQETSVPRIQEFCRVMFDYHPAMQDELALKIGDVVSIISKEIEDEGWWRGELNGKTGIFPDNFVILLPPTSQIKTNKLPTRTSTVKRPAKVNASTADQTFPVVNGPLSPTSTVQKDISTTEKKHPEMKRPESPASAGHKDQKEAKTDRDHTSKLNHFPARKTAPVPPLKSKPGVNKLATESQAKPSEEGKEKNKDSNTLDGLRVSSVKLAHPTAERPKMQGKRLPKTKNLPELVGVKEEEQVNSHIKSPTSTKAMPKFPNSPTQSNLQNTKSSTQSPSVSTSCKQVPDSAQSVQMEELAEEIRSLKFMMEILKKKHLKDMEEIRGEMSEERIKRLALQVEIENLKRLSSL